MRSQTRVDFPTLQEFAVLEEKWYEYFQAKKVAEMTMRVDQYPTPRLSKSRF